MPQSGSDCSQRFKMQKSEQLLFALGVARSLSTAELKAGLCASVKLLQPQPSLGQCKWFHQKHSGGKKKDAASSGTNQATREQRRNSTLVSAKMFSALSKLGMLTAASQQHFVPSSPAEQGAAFLLHHLLHKPYTSGSCWAQDSPHLHRHHHCSGWCDVSAGCGAAGAHWTPAVLGIPARCGQAPAWLGLGSSCPYSSLRRTLEIR